MSQLATDSSRPLDGILLALGGIAAFAAGAFAIARSVSTLTVAAAISVAWLVVVAAALWLLTRNRLAARRIALLALFGVAAIMGTAGAISSLGDRVVDEDVAQAGAGNRQLATGTFVAGAHPTEGQAAVVELADGKRMLTLTGFETDPGPDLRLYLVAGDPESEGDVDDYEDLGALKGNKGDQQYDVSDIDTDRYSTVVVWCRAFTVLFGRAPLESS